MYHSGKLSLSATASLVVAKDHLGLGVQGTSPGELLAPPQQLEENNVLPDS